MISPEHRLPALRALSHFLASGGRGSEQSRPKIEVFSSWPFAREPQAQAMSRRFCGLRLAEHTHQLFTLSPRTKEAKKLVFFSFCDLV